MATRLVRSKKYKQKEKLSYLVATNSNTAILLFTRTKLTLTVTLLFWHLALKSCSLLKQDTNTVILASSRKSCFLLEQNTSTAILASNRSPAFYSNNRWQSILPYYSSDSRVTHAWASALEPTAGEIEIARARARARARANTVCGRYANDLYIPWPGIRS